MSNHVLVVDDDPDIRSMLSLALDMEGYNVETAANGADALAAIARNPPSAMLLDMNMPVLDGWGVARTLHAQGRWVPTIVMTAAFNAPRCCAEVGADACLGKPFDIDAVFAAISVLRAS